MKKVMYIYLVIWCINSKKVIITDLTIPFVAKIDWANQRLLEKYEDLREQCVKNGWSTDIFPLEIGCRDFIPNSISTSLTKFGLSPAEMRECIKKDPKQDKTKLHLNGYGIRTDQTPSNKAW